MLRYDMWRPRAQAGTELIEQADALLALVGYGSWWSAPQRRWRMASSGPGNRVALASGPRLLLLDEPTAGMSPEETRAIMNLIVKLAAANHRHLVEHKMKLILGISYPSLCCTRASCWCKARP